MALPTKKEMQAMAWQRKKDLGIPLGHAYEQIAKEHGFNTWAAMCEAMKAEEPGK